VPIDRAAALRNAEKLLRQGKIEPAIAEYLRVVDDQPRDWNTANALGDLYVRAGQPDKAVEQFVRIADGLSADGFYPKAAALYKKAIKTKPDHEHALLQAADLAAKQGILADARAYLSAVDANCRARGDRPGSALARIKIAALDPSDYDARATAAAARAEIGDIESAAQELKVMAAELVEKGRGAEAAAALRTAAGFAPDDGELRRQLLHAYLAAGDFAQARDWASTPAELKWLADDLDLRGHHDEALDARVDVARLDPDDVETRALLARAFADRGDVARASEYLTAETAGDDPQLLLTVAQMQFASGKADEAVAAIRRLLAVDATRAAAVGQLGGVIAERDPGTGFIVASLATDVLAERQDWNGAAAVLQTFAAVAPNHVPALLRLVEVCVDGGLDAPMANAQASLADAYVAAGMTPEARFIAEDLVAREPANTTNVDRLRRILVLMNEPDPDAVIAERLSGDLTLDAADLNLDALSLEAVAFVPGQPEPVEESTPAQGGTAPHDIDIEQLLGELEPLPAATPTAQARAENVEVDLSIVLNDLKRQGAPVLQPRQTPPAMPSVEPATPAAASASAGETAPDIEDVFDQIRGEAARKSQVEEAERDYERALRLRDAGEMDACIDALASASRAPSLRFVTASLLGRIYAERGSTASALEWLERAAQAPAPTADDYHALLFDLVTGLEGAGEVARALAVGLELQTEAGSYRDIDARVDRLAKAQAGG